MHEKREANVRNPRFAVDKTSSIIRSKFSQSSANGTSNAVLQPIRISTQSHPLHPLARIRQSRQSNHRWFSTTVRSLGESAPPEQRYTTAPPSISPKLGKSSDSVAVRPLLHLFGQTSQEELYPAQPVDILSAGLGGESGTSARHQLAKHKSSTT